MSGTAPSTQSEPTLSERLSDLSFDDMELVLLWILAAAAELAPPAPTPAEVIRAFVTNGYDINVNAGIDLVVGDPDNYGRYIIGQALYELVRFGSINERTGDLVGVWLQRFAKFSG